MRLKGEGMTRIEFWSAVMGLLVAIVVMFNQINGRIDALNARVDRFQVDTNAGFDQMFDRMDSMQAENNRRFEAIDARFDTVLETIMSFDRRVSHNEGQIEVIREQIQAEGAP